MITIRGKSYVETVCSCEKCVNMCKYTRPCWGTPEEFERIIDAGYGRKLMLDWWIASPNIYFLSGAIIGYEGQRAPPIPMGQCAFLDKNNRCELHDKGLKPTEGRVVIHDQGYDDELHCLFPRTWKTKAGMSLIKRWKLEISEACLAELGIV